MLIDRNLWHIWVGSKWLCGPRLAILILRNRFFESHGIPPEWELQQASMGSLLGRIRDIH